MGSEMCIRDSLAPETAGEPPARKPGWFLSPAPRPPTPNPRCVLPPSLCLPEGKGGGRCPLPPTPLRPGPSSRDAEEAVSVGTERGYPTFLSPQTPLKPCEDVRRRGDHRPGVRQRLRAGEGRLRRRRRAARGLPFHRGPPASPGKLSAHLVVVGSSLSPSPHPSCHLFSPAV